MKFLINISKSVGSQYSRYCGHHCGKLHALFGRQKIKIFKAQPSFLSPGDKRKLALIQSLVLAAVVIFKMFKKRILPHSINIFFFYLAPYTKHTAHN